jgi:hypothetical protein
MSAIGNIWLHRPESGAMNALTIFTGPKPPEEEEAAA